MIVPEWQLLECFNQVPLYVRSTVQATTSCVKVRPALTYPRKNRLTLQMLHRTLMRLTFFGIIEPHYTLCFPQLLSEGLTSFICYFVYPSILLNLPFRSGPVWSRYSVGA